MQMTQKAKDTEFAIRFTEWYCRAHHSASPRVALESVAVDAGFYGKRTPLLCTDCADFARYVEQRTEACPHKPKPFCAVCDIKCYKSDMAEYSRMVMRYSGPRSIF